MNELQQLMSQQVDFLQKQNEVQRTCINEQEIYIEQLKKKNAFLAEQNRQLAEAPDSNTLLASIKRFETQSQELLQDKLIDVLKDLDVTGLVQDRINTEIKPLLDKIQTTQSQLTQILSEISLLDTRENENSDVNGMSDRISKLEQSIGSLEKLLKEAMDY